MTILHLSDTHSQHRELTNLPKADVIVHSGDFTLEGTRREFLDFVDWFGSLDYPHKIFVVGNHDMCFEGANFDRIQELLPENMHYLCYSGITIDGVLFWGIPLSINDSIDGSYREKLALMPPKIDVLISHSPPYGILDESGNINYGCPDLLQKVLEIKPKLHLFGHTHAAYGSDKSRNTAFFNAAITNDDYLIVNEPFKIDL